MASSTTTLMFTSSIAESVAKSVYLPNPFLGLRQPFFLLFNSQRSQRSVSFARGSHSRKNACSEVRIIGNIAQDFEAEAVFDQELFKVKLSEYIMKKYLILFFYPLDFTFPCPTEITALNNSYVFSKRILPFPVLSSKTAMSLPSTKTQKEEIQLLPVIPPTPIPSRPNLGDIGNEFQEKMLYLDSIGIDIFSLITNRPPGPILLSSSLETIKSTLNYLLSTLNLSSPELRRLIFMCPEILSLSSSTLAPVFTFLLREACVESTSDLKRAINRRPRLLISSVPHRLRPTLYFLQLIGICKTQRHTYLLSCSVEEKLLPRIHYFQEIGFSYHDAISMFRRFPQLFNYSLKDNIEPKLNYFVVEMGRDLKELKVFPQYFSFSLENRIKPRHGRCIEKGVCFSLPNMLRTSEAEFHARLEVLHGSSLPLKSSPLYSVNCDTIHSDSNATE